MVPAAKLAGFFSAHAVWCVCDGDDLVPFAACESASGERKLNRFVDESMQLGASRAQTWAVENPQGAPRTVAIYDGYITLESGKTDALLITVCVFGKRTFGLLKPKLARRFTMAVPYRNAKSGEGFAVFRPKFLEFDGDPAEIGGLADAFFEGVDAHEKGAAVWNAKMDQSR